MERDGHRIEILAEWLLEVMRRKGLSAAGWARSAGCADTTISRFLKQRRHLLRHETVQALARSAGVEPPELDLAFRSIPLVDASSRLHALSARRQELLRELRHVDQMIAAQAEEFIEAHRRQSQALGVIEPGAREADTAGSSAARPKPSGAMMPDLESTATGPVPPLRALAVPGGVRAAGSLQPVRRSRDPLT